MLAPQGQSIPSVHSVHKMKLGELQRIHRHGGRSQIILPAGSAACIFTPSCHPIALTSNLISTSFINTPEYQPECASPIPTLAARYRKFAPIRRFVRCNSHTPSRRLASGHAPSDDRPLLLAIPREKRCMKLEPTVFPPRGRCLCDESQAKKQKSTTPEGCPRQIDTDPPPDSDTVYATACEYHVDMPTWPWRQIRISDTVCDTK
ncbi:hypothetical protein FB451DRAFT_130328 [Mycena latifolia]|nr:hypothetical protein FB451DRAFT_130328 [Mycena latifolia]